MGKLEDEVADSLGALARQFPHLVHGADLSNVSVDDQIVALAAITGVLAIAVGDLAREIDRIRDEIASHRPPA